MHQLLASDWPKYPVTHQQHTQELGPQDVMTVQSNPNPNTHQTVRLLRKTTSSPGLADMFPFFLAGHPEISPREA
jgi:hypothetical protein